MLDLTAPIIIKPITDDFDNALFDLQYIDGKAILHYEKERDDRYAALFGLAPEMYGIMRKIAQGASGVPLNSPLGMTALQIVRHLGVDAHTLTGGTSAKIMTPESAANEVVILREEGNFNIGDGPNDTNAERDEQVRRWMEKNPWCGASFETLRFWLGRHWTVEERDAVAANSHSESYSSGESKGEKVESLHNAAEKA